LVLALEPRVAGKKGAYCEPAKELSPRIGTGKTGKSGNAKQPHTGNGKEVHGRGNQGIEKAVGAGPV